MDVRNNAGGAASARVSPEGDVAQHPNAGKRGEGSDAGSRGARDATSLEAEHKEGAGSGSVGRNRLAPLELTSGEESKQVSSIHGAAANRRQGGSTSSAAADVKHAESSRTSS